MKPDTVKRILLFIAVFTICRAVSASAIDPRQQNTTILKGHVFTTRLVIDEVTNLAGIKISLKYNAKVLEYVSCKKTRYVAPLMQVVNDKTPGVLIIVMAGAKGIQGKNIPVCEFTFKARSEINQQTNKVLEISECELMSDMLQKIDSKIMIKDFVITPAIK